ncbi:hypothetical protein [Mycolicibacterium sp. CR10]|uniref:hypothetical protein n=1 Tax=Mycolicibacterium sp. CR10 TaxID=2562314 RepID=UPI0010BFA0E9|nr:hypothetical protein [Mycolicibacterium sp. CR10]
MTRLSALWQRNLIASIVLACAVGAFVAIDFGPQWAAYRHSVVPEVVVPNGQSGSAAGQTWKLSAVRHQNRSPLNFGPPLPPGTVLTIVDVDRSGTPGAELCTGVITDGDQRWQAEGLGVFSPIARDGVTATCTKPGRLQFAFLLPHDVVPTAVDVTINGQITVRLEL